MLMAGEGPMCGMGDYELAQLGDGLDLYFRWLVSPSPSQVGGGRGTVHTSHVERRLATTEVPVCAVPDHDDSGGTEHCAERGGNQGR